MIAFDVLLIIILFSIFAFIHTLLATLEVKRRIVKNIGEKIAFYRLFYNISSLILFSIFYFISPKPDVIVYDLHYPFDIITFAFQVLSLFGLIWSIRTFNLKEFTGIEQIQRYLNGTYDKTELDEKAKLSIKGAAKIVRHPLYLFFILFLGLRPTMSLFYFVTFLCITAYFYIGSFYEEKRLVEIFGDKYKEYQEKVPRIFPIKFFKSK